MKEACNNVPDELKPELKITFGQDYVFCNKGGYKKVISNSIWTTKAIFKFEREGWMTVV